MSVDGSGYDPSRYGGQKGAFLDENQGSLMLPSTRLADQGPASKMSKSDLSFASALRSSNVSRENVAWSFRLLTEDEQQHMLELVKGDDELYGFLRTIEQGCQPWHMKRAFEEDIDASVLWRKQRNLDITFEEWQEVDKQRIRQRKRQHQETYHQLSKERSKRHAQSSTAFVEWLERHPKPPSTLKRQRDESNLKKSSLKPRVPSHIISTRASSKKKQKTEEDVELLDQRRETQLMRDEEKRQRLSDWHERKIAESRAKRKLKASEEAFGVAKPHTKTQRKPVLLAYSKSNRLPKPR